MEDIEFTIPTVALRGLTILPGMIVHFDISRDFSLKAIEDAMNDEQRILLVAQKDTNVSEPGEDDLYAVGVVAYIKQVLKLHNGNVRVLVEGCERAKIVNLTSENFLKADIIVCKEKEDEFDDVEKEAMLQSLKDTFVNYSNVNAKMSKEVISQVNEINNLSRLIDFIGNSLPVEYEKKQELLEIFSLEERYEKVLELMFKLIDITAIKNEFQKKVKNRVDKHQKEYILREQMGLIKEELGDDNLDDDVDNYLKEVEKLDASDAVKDKIKKEIKRFKGISSNSSESSVSRGYIETLLELPWNKSSLDNKDLDYAKEVLDKEHYGLSDVKE